MDLTSLVLILTIVVNLALGLHIFFKDSKNLINRSFSTILCLLSFLCITTLFAWRATNPSSMYFWVKSCYFFASFIAAYFLYFSFIFPRPEDAPKGILKLLLFAPAYIFSFLAYTPWIEEKVGFPFNVPATYGPAMPFFTLFVVIYVLFSAYNLIKKYLIYKGKAKLQIWYVLFGFLGTGTALIITNVVLPQIFNTVEWAGIGPAASLFMTACIGYAIVKHRLLNIDDFLSKGLFSLGVVSLLVGTFYLLFIDRLGFLIPFYTAIINLLLGLFVLSRNPRNKVNLIFSLIIFAIVVWVSAIAFYWEISSADMAFLWSKLAYASTGLIPAFFVYFVLIFPKAKKATNWLARGLILAPLIFFPLAVYFNFIVKGVEKTSWGYNLLPGPLYLLFSAYFISYMVSAVLIIVRKFVSTTGLRRMQIGYFIMGVFLGSFFPILTNLIMPLLGNTSLTRFGPSFTIISVGIIAYSILKHRLMSIEVVIKRSTVYAVSTVLIMAFYALAVIISEIFFRRVLGYTSIVITALAALFIAVMYQPLIKYFQTVTDRIFFRDRYDYQETLQEISQKIASVIKLEELTHLIASTFIDTMRVSEISFLLLDRDNEHFRSVPVLLSRYKRIEIDTTSPIVSWLCAARDILVKDEIEDEIYRQESLGKAGKLRSQSLIEVHNEMERLGISVWVPIMAKDRLIGIIALGNKLSGDLFTTEDLGLLNTLANQTAVVLENARLYDEVLGMKNYNEEVLQSMVSGVVTADFKGRIVTFNNMAEKITGRKVDEVLGKNCEEIWGKRGVIVNIIENTLQNNKCYVNFEASIASPERGIVPVAFSSTALCDRQDKKIGVLVTIQDLSEVKELEGKVRRADKLAALATMAAGMAHEIKNPLSSMKVLSQLLPLKFDDPEYRKKLGEIFPREISRIDRIVESLLGFTRASSLVFEKVDINSILKETVDYLKNQAEQAEVKITEDYAELPEIEVDNGQISQVFSNLILNAIQAMQNGGEIKVQSYPGKKVEDMLQTIKIEISDNGPGISQETIKKLFDPFFTTKYGGTGLGLTITHSIVDGHKGYIDVQSKTGEGTTFVVTLPVSQGLL